jgi:hypothetical protein
VRADVYVSTQRCSLLQIFLFGIHPSASERSCCVELTVISDSAVPTSPGTTAETAGFTPADTGTQSPAAPATTGDTTLETGMA